MTREEKLTQIENLTAVLNNTATIYLADIAALDAETTSNLHHSNFFPFIDQLIAPLNEEGYEALQPDLLLTFGGLIISKKIKAFLRAYNPKHHWHVDPYKANDTYFCLNKHFKINPNDFFPISTCSI